MDCDVCPLLQSLEIKCWGLKVFFTNKKAVVTVTRFKVLPDKDHSMYVK